MPRVILAPIFAVWFGLGITSKVALGVTLVFFIVFFNVYQGVKEVSPVVLANARMLGASRRQLLRHVYLPSATSWVFSSLHTSVGMAFVGAVVGEYLGSARGVGYLILQAEGVFDINTVFAGILVLTVFALVLDYAGDADRGAPAGVAAEDRRNRSALRLGVGVGVEYHVCRPLGSESNSVAAENDRSIDVEFDSDPNERCDASGGAIICVCALKPIGMHPASASKVSATTSRFMCVLERWAGRTVTRCRLPAQAARARGPRSVPGSFQRRCAQYHCSGWRSTRRSSTAL